jgi:hypothetical protein
VAGREEGREEGRKGGREGMGRERERERVRERTCSLFEAAALDEEPRCQDHAVQLHLRDVGMYMCI